MNEQQINDIFSYSLSIRRKLHMYPEVGFELPKTVAIIGEELHRLGISFTDKYGKCSLVAELGQGEKTLAIRADIDALPIEEKTGLPFASTHTGKMHACGHDSHAAVLLGVAKYLKEHESELPCKVRLVFQPSEEGAISGAKMMVDNGVMDGVDEVICTHCENGLDSGNVGICYGDYMAACVPATLCFIGKASHAALPEAGIDAVAMAVEAYTQMKEMVAAEAGEDKYIWNVGHFSGGTVHNIVPDSCEMYISFRFYNKEFASRVENRVREICEAVSNKYGGKYELSWIMSTGAIHNDENVTAKFEKCVRDNGIPVAFMPQKKSSEDFAWFLEKIPGMIFRFGTRSEEKGCTAPAHRSDFMIDEEGMKTAIEAFCSYVFRS